MLYAYAMSDDKGIVKLVISGIAGGIVNRYSPSKRKAIWQYVLSHKHDHTT